MALSDYQKKRHFDVTPEPKGGSQDTPSDIPLLRFTIHKHAARRLHYDLRLELDGVLKSWAIPKGPCLDPQEKRLAIHVEDHPIEYLTFEGVIPKGEYGAGPMLVWDQGTWIPVSEGPGYEAGQLKFELNGHKLQGRWMLVRTSRPSDKQDQWLFFKERDAMARPLSDLDVLKESPLSVISGRSIEEVRDAPDDAPSDMPTAAATERKSKQTTATKRRAGRPQGTRRIKMPDLIAPCLPTAVETAPVGDQWIHEIKFDGYRMVCYKRDKKVKFMSRNGLDWSDKFAHLVPAIRRLPASELIVDGEVVFLNASGLSDFQQLQNTISSNQSAAIQYFAFDLMYLDGYDYRDVALSDRKEALEQLFADLPQKTPLALSEHLRGDGPLVFQQICQLGAEGIVSKLADRRYVSGRTELWLKVKCVESMEFVIGGYTDSSVRPRSIGALHIGYFDADGELHYAGKVGTGFTESSLAELYRLLSPSRQNECPFVGYTGDAATLRKSHWVTPQLTAEVEFGNWTHDGRVRFARFKGLRDDLPAEQIEFEDVTTRPESEPVPEFELPDSISELTLSHPDRILFPASGTTKLGLATYYAQVARWMLPHVIHRPLSLLRCPRGSQEKCFFQKRPPAGLPDLVQRISLDEGGTGPDSMMITDLAGLLALVQYGVLEFHVWTALADRLDRPDQVIFDLDPDTDVVWPRVIEAGVMLRDYLAGLGLVSFPKVTGGKGLHVVVPIRRRSAWDVVKQFSKHTAAWLQQQSPGRFTISSSKKARRGKIYIDYLRNTRGATVIAPFSTRARSVPSVSVPLDWDELATTSSADVFTVDNLIRRLHHQSVESWSGAEAVTQTITREMYE